MWQNLFCTTRFVLVQNPFIRHPYKNNFLFYICTIFVRKKNPCTISEINFCTKKWLNPIKTLVWRNALKLLIYVRIFVHFFGKRHLVNDHFIVISSLHLWKKGKTVPQKTTPPSPPKKQDYMRDAFSYEKVFCLKTVIKIKTRKQVCDAFSYEKVILPKTVLHINTRKQVCDAFSYEKVILPKNSFTDEDKKTCVMHFRTKEYIAWKQF